MHGEEVEIYQKHLFCSPLYTLHVYWCVYTPSVTEPVVYIYSHYNNDCIYIQRVCMVRRWRFTRNTCSAHHCIHYMCIGVSILPQLQNQLYIYTVIIIMTVYIYNWKMCFHYSGRSNPAEEIGILEVFVNLI